MQMIFRLYTSWLFGVALTLLGFGSGASASAQTTYPFEATYNAEITTRPIIGNISEATDIGESADAPYGLTSWINMNYAEFNPDTGVFTFGPDPATFGLEGLPIGTLTLSGNGSDKLFGTVSGSVSVDFENLVGTGSSTITITGGTGLFENATGEITFTQNDRLTSTNLTDPFEGQAILNFSVQTAQAVPEPSTNATLVGASVIGFGLLLRRHRRKSAMSNLINRGD